MYKSSEFYVDPGKSCNKQYILQAFTSALNKVTEDKNIPKFRSKYVRGEG